MSDDGVAEDESDAAGRQRDGLVLALQQIILLQDRLLAKENQSFAQEVMLSAVVSVLQERGKDFEQKVILALHNRRTRVRDPDQLAEIERLSRSLL